MEIRNLSGIAPRAVRFLFVAFASMIATHGWCAGPSKSGGKTSNGGKVDSTVEVKTASPSGQKEEVALPLMKYSGVWLTGTYSEARERFPVGVNYALQLADGEGDTGLTQLLLRELRAAAKAGGRRLVDGLADDGHVASSTGGEAYLLACGINYEHVESVEIGGVNKVMAEVGFDLMICDFANRSIVVTLPGRVMRIDVSKTAKVSDDQKRAMLQTLYQNELVKQFVKLASAHGPEIFGIATIGVTKVTLFDEAVGILPSFLKDRYEEFFSNVAASNFYEGAGIPLTPLSRGTDMLFCGMRVGLSDEQKFVANSEQSKGGGLTFSLHRPDYEMELVIPAFRTVTASASAAGKYVQNCCYSRITIKRGDLVIYSSQHEASVQNLIPKGSSEKVPWLAYSDSANELFFKSSKLIRGQTSGSDKVQEKPMLVVKPPLLKQCLIECAPWTLISKNKS